MGLPELWQHQSDILNRFKDLDQIALFLEMGVGKTRIAVEWLKLKKPTKTLVISPISVCSGWEKELKNHGIKSVIIKKPNDFNHEADYFLINYDKLVSQRYLTEITSRNFDAVICDESQRIKNHASKRFKALCTFAKYAKYKAILTGTPILQDALDLWSQYFFLDSHKKKDEPYYLTDSYYLYRSTYFHDKNAGMPKHVYFPNYVIKPNSVNKITERVAPFTSQVKKSECLTLPPLVYQTIDVELSSEQRRLYDQMANDLVTYINDDACAVVNALSKTLRLLQIISGHLPTEENGMQVIKDNPRLVALHELLESLMPNKVVIWTVFKQSYIEIQKVLESLKLNYVTMTGLTKNKQASLETFRDDPKCTVMLGNPSAAGTGVDGLQVASYAVYFDRNFSLEQRLQSEARTYRGGSEIHSKITVYDIVAANTIDQNVLDALKSKEDFANNLLARLKAIY